MTNWYEGLMLTGAIFMAVGCLMFFISIYFMLFAK